MTLPKSSNRTYLHVFHRAYTGAATAAGLCMVVMILLIPVSTTILPEYSIFNIDYTHNQMKYRFFYDSLHPFVNGWSVISGMIIAIIMFRFMLVRRYSDTYFSFGIKRYKLFLLHSIAGVFHLLWIVYVPMIMTLAMNIKAFGQLGYTSDIVCAFWYMSAGLFTEALIGFTIMSLSCCVAGTILEASFFSIVLLGVPSFVFYGINILANHLLFGNAFGVTTSSGTSAAESLLESLSYLNPLMFFWTTSEHYNLQTERFDGYVLPDMQWIRVIGWIVAVFVILLITILLLNKRKAEICGVSGQNKFMQFFTTFFLGFFGFSVTLNLLYSNGEVLSIGAASLVFITVYCITQMLHTRQLVRGIWKLPVQIGCVLIIVFVLATGGLGYSTRIPDIDNIENITMSYVGTPDYLSGQPQGTSDGSQYYISSSYTFESQSDIETVIGLHKEIIAAGKGKLSLNTTDFSSTTVPYDIEVHYTLKDGSTLTRYYDRTTYDVLEKLLALDDTQEVSQSIQNTILNGDGLYYASGAFKSGNIYLSNSWYTNPRQLSLTSEQRTTLLNCIAQDVATQSTEQRYFSQGDVMGVIMFSLGSSDSLNFGYDFNNTVIYLTSEFTNTLAFFENAGLSYCFDFSDEIESISLQAYNPYVSKVNTNINPTSAFFMGYSTQYAHQYIQVKDFGADLELTDINQIQQVSSLLKNDYFMSKGGYLACVKIKGKEQYVYKFLPAQDAPSYVVSQLQ